MQGVSSRWEELGDKREGGSKRSWGLRGPEVWEPPGERCTDLLAPGCCSSRYRARTSSPVAHAWSTEGTGVPGGS